MKERLLSSFLAIPLLIWLCTLTNLYPLFILVTFVIILALNEFYEITKTKFTIPKYLAIITGMTCFFAAFFFGIVGMIYSLILGVIFVIIFEISKGRTDDAILRISLICFANFYIPCFLSYLFFIAREFPKNFLLCLLLTTWATDSFAYFIGVSFGKHKLCPSVSPKKSVEGAVGGTLFGVLTFVSSHYLLINPARFFELVAFALIVSLSAQLGDLFASLFKRDFGVKDFSQIIPGHGGLMDRLDSLLFVFPTAFYLGKVLKF
ncbi:phosphatidate cytidylyltransferase [Candidatus Riflebacteria bacterium]